MGQQVMACPVGDHEEVAGLDLMGRAVLADADIAGAPQHKVKADDIAVLGHAHAPVAREFSGVIQHPREIEMRENIRNRVHPRSLDRPGAGSSALDDRS